jgi:hypothetical protein
VGLIHIPPPPDFFGHTFAMMCEPKENEP